jgi:WD40 repeat protein
MEDVRHATRAGRGWRALPLAALFLLSACATSTSGRSALGTPMAGGTGAVSLVATLQSGTTRVTSVTWSPDGTRLAAGLVDATARVWDIATGQVLATYKGHSGAVLAVAWSPDGRSLASGGDDGTARVWDARTGATLRVYRGHVRPITALAWSPDGRSVASGSLDGTARVWEAATGRDVAVYRGHKAGVRALAWSPDGRSIASAGDDGTAQIWDAASGFARLVYRGHAARLTAVAWSPDGEDVASSSFDKTMQVWSADTGMLLYTYRGNRASAPVSDPLRVLPDKVFDVAWSHDGKRIAIVTEEYCGDECSVVLTWDALTQANVRLSPTVTLFALAWSPDDRLLAAGEAAGVQVFAAK